MKTSLMTQALAGVVVGGALGCATPIFGDDAAQVAAGMLNQAYDLVHKAWNPGGDPPSAAEQTDLLTKALKLTQDAPDHHLRGTRVQAVLDLKAALAMLKNGDPDHKLNDLIHTAADDLRAAASLAE